MMNRIGRLTVAAAVLMAGPLSADPSTEKKQLEKDDGSGLVVSPATLEAVTTNFDHLMNETIAHAPEAPGVGVAGKVVERFAPPVASGAGAAAFDARTDGRGALSVNALRPCDTPGAACRNFGGLQSATVPINPPIIAGDRPVPASN